MTHAQATTAYQYSRYNQIYSLVPVPRQAIHALGDIDHNTKRMIPTQNSHQHEFHFLHRYLESMIYHVQPAR